MPSRRDAERAGAAVPALTPSFCAFCNATLGELDGHGDAIELERSMMSRIPIDAAGTTRPWFICVDKAACAQRRAQHERPQNAERPLRGLSDVAPGERSRETGRS